MLFVDEPEIVPAEPLNFVIEQPPEDLLQEPDKVAAPEEMEAKTPEQSREPAETSDPYSEGFTNLRRFQTTPENRQGLQQPERSAAESGREILPEQLRHEIQPGEESEPEGPGSEEVSRMLEERLKEPLFEGELPVMFDQRRPSSADPVEGMVQFDTYEWDYIPYRDKLLYKLYLYWVPKLRQVWQFQLGRSGRTIYRFVILRDGNAVNIELLDTSTMNQYDLAARYSIEQPYPGLVTEFPPLPEHFPKQTLVVTVGFFVNMYPPRER